MGLNCNREARGTLQEELPHWAQLLKSKQKWSHKTLIIFMLTDVYKEPPQALLMPVGYTRVLVMMDGPAHGRWAAQSPQKSNNSSISVRPLAAPRAPTSAAAPGSRLVPSPAANLSLLGYPNR